MSSAEKDALIATLLARIDELSKRLDALEKENAALRAKLKLPPKTPDNSSTPPARGQKGSDTTPSQPKGKAHPGTHRPLHPHPTRKRDVLADQCLHCGTDVSGVTQAPVHTYDRIEAARHSGRTCGRLPSICASRMRSRSSGLRG